jgi:hypothetical protein
MLPVSRVFSFFGFRRYRRQATTIIKTTTAGTTAPIITPVLEFDVGLDKPVSGILKK